MICIVQRVIEAQVSIDDEIVGKIGAGMLVLAAVERGDNFDDVQWMAAKLVGMRIFRNVGKDFDLDIKQIGGSVLLVSNFTVAAATRKGRRPSFDPAADPADAQPLFQNLVDAVKSQGVQVQIGQFGAAMLVSLVNDGPATFVVKTDPHTQML